MQAEPSKEADKTMVEAKTGAATESPTLLSTEGFYEAACPTMLPQQNPSTDELGKKQLIACGHLHHLLVLWNQGGCQPVTFGQIRKYCLAGQETHDLMKCLLGEQLWDGWFSLAGAHPEDNEPLPCQALTYVALALDNMKTQYEGVEESKKTAAESFARFTSETKRRRLATTAN